MPDQKDETKRSEAVPVMAEDPNPLATFFHKVIEDLRKKMTLEELTDTLNERNVDPENKGTGANTTSPPGQTPAPAD